MITPGFAPQDVVVTRRFYDRLSKVYDVITDSSEHSVRERGVRALALAPGARVLEVGFGTGHGLVAMADAVGSSGRVYGVDVSAGMASVARQRILGRDHILLVQADAKALSVQSAAFDTVFFSFTLELFGPSVQAVLREARRALRPRGRLGVVGLARPATRSAVTDVYLWLHRHYPHLFDCAPLDIAGAVADAGFDVEFVDSATIWTLPVAIVVGRVSADAH